MITYKELTEDNYEVAMALRISCWTEELNGKGENTLDLKTEVEDLKNWVSTAEINNDCRLIIGAFEDDKMIGFAAGSFAETFDIEENGFELNYLFVDEKDRGRNISIALLKLLIDSFTEKDCSQLIVYNHHFAPSNTFYQKYGGVIFRQEEQGKDKLLIDVFSFELEKLKDALN